MAKITILPELQSLIPALSDEERQGLKDSIIANGIEVGIALWQQEPGVLVCLDGHNRLEIADELKKETGTQPAIPYLKPKSVKEIPDLEAAQLWVLKNQLHRRNLTDAARVNLAAKYANEIAKQRRMHAAAEREAEKLSTQHESSCCVPNELTTGKSANGDGERLAEPNRIAAKQFGVTEREVRAERDVIKAAEEREEMIAAAVAPIITAEQRRAQRLNEIAAGAKGQPPIDSDWQKQHEVEAYKTVLAEAVKIRASMDQKGLTPKAKAGLKKKLKEWVDRAEVRWKGLQAMGVSAAELPHPSSLKDKDDGQIPKPGKTGAEWLSGLIRSLDATTATYSRKYDAIDPGECLKLIDDERQNLRNAVNRLMRKLEEIAAL